MPFGSGRQNATKSDIHAITVFSIDGSATVPRKDTTIDDEDICDMNTTATFQQRSFKMLLIRLATYNDDDVDAGG